MMYFSLTETSMWTFTDVDSSTFIAYHHS